MERAESIIGQFPVEGEDSYLIVTIAIGVNKNSVYGAVKFYKDENFLFALDMSDANLLGDVLKRHSLELYDSVIQNIVAISMAKDEEEKDKYTEVI